MPSTRLVRGREAAPGNRDPGGAALGKYLFGADAVERHLEPPAAQPAARVRGGEELADPGVGGWQFEAQNVAARRHAERIVSPGKEFRILPSRAPPISSAAPGARVTAARGA